MRITTRVGRGTYLSVGGCGLLIITVIILGVIGWLLSELARL